MDNFAVNSIWALLQVTSFPHKRESTLWGGCFLPSPLPMVNGCGGGDHPALGGEEVLVFALHTASVAESQVRRG